jgi:3-mercaptopyruvate sulfurtransferase SseA
LITVDELAARLHDPTLVILDATVLLPPPRFDGDYQVESGFARFREAHIPNARFADLTGELSDHHAAFHFAMPAPGVFDSEGRYLNPTALADVVKSVLPPANRPLILYCGGGISAAADALALTLLGETDVSIYDGSLEEWAAIPELPLVLGN